MLLDLIDLADHDLIEICIQLCKAQDFFDGIFHSRLIAVLN